MAAVYENSHGDFEVEVFSTLEGKFSWYIFFNESVISSGTENSLEEAKVAIGGFFRKVGDYAREYPEVWDI